MLNSDDDLDDPTYHPHSESESDTDSDATIGEGCCFCRRDEDEWFIDNGSPEDALLTGLVAFVANRHELAAEHVPLYKQLLRDLLNEANELYR